MIISSRFWVFRILSIMSLYGSYYLRVDGAVHRDAVVEGVQVLIHAVHALHPSNAAEVTTILDHSCKTKKNQYSASVPKLMTMLVAIIMVAMVAVTSVVVIHDAMKVMKLICRNDDER